MPILETCDPESELEQGDLLKGVSLHWTKLGDSGSLEAAKKCQFDYCLVLSRPCVIEHKSQIVVAAVQAFPQNTPSDIHELDEALAYLKGLRDGTTRPDCFYLGQLPPPASGRYYARFDSLHTLDIPTAKPLRQSVLAKHRIARLNADFRRHLHTGFFSAFAVQGFHDHRWFSDADIDWVLATAAQELSRLNAEMDTARAARQADGGKDNEKKLREHIEDLAAQMKPYKDERDRRSSLGTA
jgi:hypothetical protein